MAKPLYRADGTSWEARVRPEQDMRPGTIGLILLGASYLIGAALENGNTTDPAVLIAATSIRGIFLLGGVGYTVYGFFRPYIPRTARSTSKAFIGAPELSEQVRDIIARYLHALARNNDRPLGGNHLGIASFITAQERLARAQQRLVDVPTVRAQRRYEKVRAAAAEAHAYTLGKLDRFEKSQIIGEQNRLAQIETNGG